MKQSDLITIIIMGVSGVLVSFFAVNAILGNPSDKTKEIKNIEVVSADLAEPDPEIFNEDAINPTIEVYVGDCQDIDQNGILDRAELVACGQAEPEIDEDAEEVTEEDTEEDTED